MRGQHRLCCRSSADLRFNGRIFWKGLVPTLRSLLRLVTSEHQAVVIASLIAAAHRLQRRKNQLPRPLWALLDEFGAVGRLPNLLDALTTLPGASVSIAIGLQSVPQVETGYGQSDAKVALEAVHGMTIFPGLGFDSASWVSDRLDR